MEKTYIQSDLTKGSITKHIKNIMIPASIGFLFNTLFNVVDTIYAGQLSKEALAGLTVSFPIFFIIIAISSGLGSAVAALASNALGKKDYKNFHQIAFNSYLIGITIGLILIILAPVITMNLFLLLGAEGDVLDLGVSYTNMIFYGSIFFILIQISNGLLSAQGNTRSNRNFLIFGFFLNLILDPLLIFGWFDLPRLGVVGVALATVIVQLIGTIYMTYRLYKSSVFDINTFKSQRFSFSIFKSIIKQAIPSTLNLAMIAIGIFIINYYVLMFGGTDGIASYGASVRIEQIALLPALGLNIAVLTLIGQNFGANQLDRMNETIIKSLKIGITMMFIGGILLFFFSPLLVSMFNSDENVIKIGVRYLRIQVFTLSSYVIINIFTSFLQGIKKPSFIIIIGIYRQVLPFLIFYLLGYEFNLGLDGVWFGILIINWSAAIILSYYTYKVIKKLNKV
jgi:putative MATE family efflux protein